MEEGEEGRWTPSSNNSSKEVKADSVKASTKVSCGVEGEVVVEVEVEANGRWTHEEEDKMEDDAARTNYGGLGGARHRQRCSRRREEREGRQVSVSWFTSTAEEGNEEGKEGKRCVGHRQIWSTTNSPG